MKAFLFDLDGTLLGADENEFMRAYFGELTRALHGLLPAEGLARNILAATARMQADTSPDSTNPAKFRKQFEALYQGVHQQPV
jgi:FMN phosphatase YigB (HAD superfamily)